MGDVVVQVLGRVANLVPGVIVTLILARHLGSAGFGQWSTLLAVIQIATYFCDFGLEQVALRRATLEPERESEWTAALLTLRIAIAIPIMLVTAGVQLIIAEGAAMRAAGLILSSVLLLSAFTSLRITFQLRVRNALSIAVVSLNSIVWMAGVVLVAGDRGGIAAYSVAFVIAAAAAAVLNTALALRISPIRLRGSPALWRALTQVGLPLAGVAVLQTAYGKVDQILLFLIAGDREAGLYGAAYRILDQAQFLPVAVITTFLPVISAAWPGDAAHVRRLSQLTGDWLGILSLPALGFSAAAAEPIMRLLFGPEFVAGAPALPLLMAAFVCISLSHLSGALVLVTQLQRRLLVYAVVALVLNVLLNLALIPPFGFVAAAAVTLLTEFVVMLLAFRAVFAAIEFRPSLGRLGRAAMATAGMTAMVWAVRSAGVPLAGLLAVGAASYAVLAFLLGAVTTRDLRQLAALRRSDGGDGEIGQSKEVDEHAE
jgi:O-antigen/teichoic acid export membrane protein